MDLEKIKEKIELDTDFVYYPRLGNSITKIMEKHPQGLENDKIAKVLLMTEEEVEETFQSAIRKIQKSLNIK